MTGASISKPWAFRSSIACNSGTLETPGEVKATVNFLVSGSGSAAADCPALPLAAGTLGAADCEALCDAPEPPVHAETNRRSARGNTSVLVRFNMESSSQA
jgi:hypothetical protein